MGLPVEKPLLSADPAMVVNFNAMAKADCIDGFVGCVSYSSFGFSNDKVSQPRGWQVGVASNPAE